MPVERYAWVIEEEASDHRRDLVRYKQRIEVALVSTAHLPPKPDETAGTPRPPRAPLYGTSNDSNHDPSAAAPEPPDGCGPALEWYVVSNRTAWLGATLVVVFIPAFLSIFYGISWMSVWWMWLIITIGAVLIFVGIRGTFFAAGADWLRTSNGWVNTYELTEVEIHLHGVKIDLFLKDSSGRATNNQIADLQANHDLWDLVYNGIRHSAANGAKVNSYARGALKLGNAGKAG